MKKISTIVRWGVFMAVSVCLLSPCTVLSREDKGIDGLREQVAVLEQARLKAAAELSAKEEQGIATDRDQEHYKTVTGLLEQRIEEICARLIARGGTAAVSSLSCPDEVMPETGRQEQVFKKSATGTTVQVADTLQQKNVSAEKQDEFPAVLPESAQEARAEPEVVVPPDQGFLETVRQWWESLFSRKTQASGDSAGEPEEQKGEAEKSITDAGVSPGEASTMQDTTATAGSAHQEHAGSGNEQHPEQEHGAGREAAQQESRTEQAAEAGNEVDPQPAEMDQVAAPKASNSEGRTVQHGADEPEAGELSGSGGNNTTAPHQVQPLPGIAEKKTGGRTTEDQQQSASGRNRGTPGTAPSTTAAIGTGGEREQLGSGSSGTGPQETGRAETGTAHGTAARLEQSLQDALDEFDGTLLSEQKRLSARLPQQRADGAGGYGGTDFAASQAQGIDGGGSPEGGQESGNGRTGTGGGGRADSVATAGAQPDTGSGSSSIDTDDDIVARQLREAAEQEKDPVLQKKLWQEYKKYKQGR